MAKNFKQSVKFLFQKMGVLSFAIKLANVYEAGHISSFLGALKSYIFNNWMTFLPNHYIRTRYLKYCMGVKLGESSFIYMGCRFEGNISIGNHSVIGRNCVLNGDITIKNNVSITAETYIFTWSHFSDSPVFSAFLKPVVIEDHVWIGARAMIFPGVTIGKGAILGAASSATKDIPDWSISVGVPAREIGKRPDNLDYTLIHSPYFQ